MLLEDWLWFNDARGMTLEEHGFREWFEKELANAWDGGAYAVDTQYEHIFNGHPVAEGEMCDVCEMLSKNPYRKEQA